MPRAPFSVPAGPRRFPFASPDSPTRRARLTLTGMPVTAPDLAALAARLTGEFHPGRLMRALYATDASEYQESPLAVALPRSEADVRELVRFAATHRIGLIPRTAAPRSPARRSAAGS